MQEDILNVQGYDAEYLLDDMNTLRARLRFPMPPIMRQELEEQIDIWKLVLEASGHRVRLTANGYELQRHKTEPLAPI